MATVRRIFVFVICILACAVSSLQGKSRHASCHRRDGTKPPHVLLLLIDDLGWNDVSYHGSTISTPNIDRLAGEGIKLENYYTQPMCTPSRSALLTGRYPIRTGMQHFALIVDEPWGLPLGLKILPERLKKLGYRTHLVGKWHLGFYKCEHTPLSRGFDSFFGYYPALEDHWQHTRMDINALYNNSTPDTTKAGQYSTEIYTQRSIDIINAHNGNESLFLYVAYSAVHTPLQASQQYIDKYKHIADPSRRHYAAMVEQLDANIGQVEQALKDKGIWDDTLLIFLADNGGMPGWGGASNYPLRGIKSSLWEGGVKGVAFARGNMLQTQGTTSKDLIHVTDWFPTLLHMAGSNVTASIDGVSIWETLKSGTPSTRNEILLNIDMPQTAEHEQETSYGFGTYNGAAIRQGHMKLLMRTPNSDWYGRPEDGAPVPDFDKLINDRQPFIELALYNITADPEERHDVKDTHPAIVNFLKQRIKSYKVNTPLNQEADPNAKILAKRYGTWRPWRTQGRPECIPSPRRGTGKLMVSSHVMLILLEFTVFMVLL